MQKQNNTNNATTTTNPAVPFARRYGWAKANQALFATPRLCLYNTMFEKGQLTLTIKGWGYVLLEDDTLIHAVKGGVERMIGREQLGGFWAFIIRSLGVTPKELKMALRAAQEWTYYEGLPDIDEDEKKRFDPYYWGWSPALDELKPGKAVTKVEVKAKPVVEEAPAKPKRRAKKAEGSTQPRRRAKKVEETK